MSELDIPIWGAEAIGKVINRTTRQTFYLLSRGELPATKIGGRFCTTPRRLLEAVNATHLRHTGENAS